MRMWRTHAWCLVFGLLACGTAAAQDHGDVGITIAYPSAVGVIVHAGPNVAIRPDFTFSKTSNEGSSVTTDAWSFGTGVSALFYVGGEDRVRTYVSPRFEYTRSSADSDSSAVTESTAHAWEIAGSFGAEYTPSSSFAVFGEVGLAHRRGTSEAGFGDFELKSRATGLRAGVGIIFYP